MSSTYSVIRRAARSTQDRSDAASSKSNNNKPLTIEALTKSINSVEDRASRQRLAALQRQAIASGGAYTQVERDMIQRLVTAVKDGGNLELALAAEVIDVVGDLAKRNPKGELYENQREIAFLLLDAIGSNKHDQKQLEPIIDEFRKLSTDDDGFTEKDAQRIRDLLRNLDMLDEAADGGKRPGGSYKDIDDFADSQPGKLVPGKLVPDVLDLGDFKLPKDGGKGRGGAGGKDDDEAGKGAGGEAKPKPGDVAAAIGVIQGLGGGADKKDDQGKDGKDDARGTDDKGRDPKGKDTEGKDPEGKDTRGKDDKGQDTRGQDPDGTGGARGKDGKDPKGKGDDRRVEGPDGPPTDIKLPRNVIDGKFPEGTRVQDPEDPKGKGEDGRVEADGPPSDIKLPRNVIDGKFPEGTRVQDPENPVKSNPDDVDGGNEAITKDPEKPQTEEPTSKGTDEVGEDGRPLTGRVSGTLSFVLLRTPVPKWMEDGKVEDIVGRVFSLGRSSGDKFSVLQFRFVKGDIKNGKQLYDLQQRVPGKGEGSWEVISGGWSGDAQAQWGKTYEWTAGAAANVGAGNSGDVLDGSGVTGYTQAKLLDTLRVQDESWDKQRPNDKRDAKRQFRVRLITQAQIGTGWGKDGDGGNSVGPAGFDPLKVEYRWGYTTNTPAVPGTKLPSASTQYEWGFSVGIGVGLDLVKIGAAADDPRKFLDILAATPSLTGTVQFWVTGLKRLERWTIAKESRLARGPQNWKKDVLGAVLLGIRKTFQSWVLSGNISLTGRGNNADAPKDDELGVRFVPQSSTGTSGSQATTGAGNGGLPTLEELESMAEKSMAQFDKLMDWLDKSGLADLAKTAAPIIELASLANDVRKLASKKGFLKFAIEQLTPEQRERLDVLIMSRAFDLAMSASVEPGKDGKPDARKSFTMLGGESVAEYGARILKLVGGKLAQAAKDVLLDEASWDDFLFASTSSSGSGSGSSGGGPIAGGDPTAGGKAAAIGAAIGAGLGLSGLLAGLGKDDDNKDDKGDKGKDVDKPTATGGPGGSRNAALKAVHEADEAQGDRLPVTVEAEASIYITPKLAADPVYMAAYVARLAQDQDDVATARKYAAAMSDLGYSKDAARVLAPLLTNAEIADPAFMKTLDAALAGIKRQPSDIGGVIYETQVKAALETLRGKQPATPSQVRGALEALRGKQPADPSAEPTGGGSRDKAPTDTDDPGNTNTEEPETEEPETELPTTARQKLAELIVQTGSKKDLWANVDEMRAGLEELGYATGHLSDEQITRLISAYNADGNGAMSAPQIAQALQDGALLADGATVGIDLGAAFGQPGAPLNIAQRVLRNGSDKDAWANRRELEKGFEAAGFDVKARDEEMDRVIATYGVSGTGALTAQELASAIEDGVIHLGADGSVTVNTRALQAVQGEGASNIASRVIGATDQASDSRNGNLPYEFFMRVGFRNAGYNDSGVSGDDLRWLIDTYGDGARIAQEGLARAIAEGAVRIAADGVVTINRNPTPATRGSGIDVPGVGQSGSIVLEDQSA